MQKLRDFEDLMRDVHAKAEVFTGSHFIYTSDKHGDGYANYRPLGAKENELLLREVCVHLLRKTLTGVTVEKYRNIVVVGPETMGAKMITQIQALTEEEMPYNLHTRTFKKDPARKGEFLWDADPQRILNDDSLVVWMGDLLNQWSTFQKTAPMIYRYGATIHSLTVIGDRSTISPMKHSVRNVVSLERFSLQAYEEEGCPLCEQGIPVVNNLGHGANWQLAHPDYPGGFVTSR